MDTGKESIGPPPSTPRLAHIEAKRATEQAVETADGEVSTAPLPNIPLPSPVRTGTINLLDSSRISIPGTDGFTLPHSPASEHPGSPHHGGKLVLQEALNAIREKSRTPPPRDSSQSPETDEQSANEDAMEIDARTSLHPFEARGRPRN
ncbi:hypothetical protein LTR86_010126 [Recurvomyces mirabilis]|nr:hypothetical protein LTR86_010126 [Recurvomyces mirabilis]